MTTESEQLDLEIKRTQLMREQLALEDEIKRRERRDAAAGMTQTVLGTTASTGAVVGRGVGQIVSGHLWPALIVGFICLFLWALVAAVMAARQPGDFMFNFGAKIVTIGLVALPLTLILIGIALFSGFVGVKRFLSAPEPKHKPGSRGARRYRFRLIMYWAVAGFALLYSLIGHLTNT